MISDGYQMWLTFNGEAEKLRFPFLPDKISVSNGSKNTSVDIVGLGEIVIKQDRPAIVISFSGFFPAAPFPGMAVEDLTNPLTLRDTILQWK
ncbi:MAG: hypothetical protein LBR72_02625, partial [Oscillospiraceae bacterium]|nr:hypothetical protein [Oscillospiraceae bacterium]